ncbi:MAG TPA: GatB/YqeY domain-containing protein [Vicinamibacterales bacterium]|nr:GatB/YqeY domain-containing protein [Vicinamibacterales bacterium]
MSLLAQINSDIATAMRAREAERLGTLRLLKSALVNRAIERGHELDEAEERQVVQQMIKQRRDAIDQFRAGGREDLAVKDEGEIALLSGYLPPAADEATIEAAVDAAIAETGAASVKDMGKVMKATLARLAEVTADGRLVSETVKRKLSAKLS